MYNEHILTHAEYIQLYHTVNIAWLIDCPMSEISENDIDFYLYLLDRGFLPDDMISVQPFLDTVNNVWTYKIYTR